MTEDDWPPPTGSVENQAIAWLSEIKASGEERRVAFETWYAVDAAHANAFDALLDDWDKTAIIGQTDEARARAARARRRRYGPHRLRYGFAAAAAVLLVIAAGAGRWSVGMFGGPAASVEFASGVGELRTVTLADGSRVTLDTDTVIRADLAPDERRLRLERGRARFEVAHDASRPFIVSADGGSVTAHGTVFDVALMGGTVTVALLRGSIEVHKSRPDRTSAARQLLVPGQWVSLSATSPLSAPRRMRNSETEWTTGMLAFDDTSLADAVAAANRYSKTKILLGRGVAPEQRITGRFPAKDSRGFAASLAASFDLVVGRDASNNVTLGPRKSSR